MPDLVTRPAGGCEKGADRAKLELVPGCPSRMDCRFPGALSGSKFPERSLGQCASAKVVRPLGCALVGRFWLAAGLQARWITRWLVRNVWPAPRRSGQWFNSYGGIRTAKTQHDVFLVRTLGLMSHRGSF